MKLRRPSPATVISIIALIMAMSGTAVAAVNYANNAGKVDGKDAHSSRASNKAARGDLVATDRGNGRIPERFISSLVMRGQTSKFGQSVPVNDNAAGAPTPIGGIPGLGTLTAACNDQNTRTGVEDPTTTLTFANQSGEAVNVARQVGRGQPVVLALPNGAADQFAVNASNTFSLHVERRGINYLVNGVVRQDGAGTAGAFCLVYGVAQKI
jgi:hypothetical protein